MAWFSNWIRRIRFYIRKHWHPKRIPRPEVDPNLSEMNVLERVAEVFRFILLSIEFWLSPEGNLREWLRWVAKAFFALLLPVGLLTPLVTFALWQLMQWADYIVATTSSLILFPLAAVLVVALIAVLFVLAKTLIGMWIEGGRWNWRRPYYR